MARQKSRPVALDFGLAKAVQGERGHEEASPSNSPTLTARATELGIVLGTAAYMAPAQAKGRMVDRRADVWAFGVVLYEMLTGRRAFAGDDVTEVMAAVLRDAPSHEALPAGTPAAIRRLLRRCLDGAGETVVLEGVGGARYVETGHLVYGLESEAGAR